MPVELHYASPKIVTPRPVLFRIAVGCGLSVLVGGVGIFALWLLVGGKSLMLAGVLWIPIGCLLFVVSVVTLIAYTWIQRKVDGRLSRGLLKRVVLAALLLLANFPAAYGCLSGASYLGDCRLVVVSNESDTLVDSFVIDEPGGSHELGPIAVHSTVSHRFRTSTRGSINYRVAQGHRITTGRIAFKFKFPTPLKHRVVLRQDGPPSVSTVARLW
ncbi:MAG TPA: hypothetical protein VGI81_15365 [Tepidisphaeraceae bacterium]